MYNRVLISFIIILSATFLFTENHDKIDFSGLKKTRKSLSNIEEISVVEFKNSDIVRNKIVSKILEVFPDR